MTALREHLLIALAVLTPIALYVTILGLARLALTLGWYVA